MIKDIKHIVLLWLSFCCFNIATAQQLPLSNLYFLDGYTINPALAGAQNTSSIYAIHRKQWLNIDGAPTTNFIGFNSPLYKRLNVGIKYEGDLAHILRTNKALVSLSYNLPVTNSINIRVGLSGGIIDQKIDPSGAVATDYTDILLANGTLNSTALASEAGFALIAPSFTLGFSVPHLINNNNDFSVLNGTKSILLSNSYIVHGRYDYKAFDNLILSPVILYRFIPTGHSQLDIQGIINYKQKFQFGVGYRLDESILVSAGFNITKKIALAYSYGVPVSGISGLSSGTHEIGLKVKFGKGSGKSETSTELDSLLKRTKALETSQKKHDSIIALTDSLVDDLEKQISKYKDSLELINIIRAELAKSPREIKVVEGNNVPSEEIKVGKKYTLNGIQFEFNSFDLTDSSKLELNEVVNFLNKYPTVEVAIHGYTDNMGGDLFNLILSKNRARAVFLYLVKNGIRASRLRFDGFGESNPVATNGTEEGRAKNRRIEFVILSK